MNGHRSPTIEHTPETKDGAFIKSLQVPHDAGRYRDALTTVLLRIPSGYEQRIACGPGWYPLISKLHKLLCSIDIDYVVYGVTNCGGMLEYNAECQSDNPAVQNLFSNAVAESRRQSRTICEGAALGGPDRGRCSARPPSVD